MNAGTTQTGYILNIKQMLVIIVIIILFFFFFALSHVKSRTLLSSTSRTNGGFVVSQLNQPRTRKEAA